MNPISSVTIILCKSDGKESLRHYKNRNDFYYTLSLNTLMLYIDTSEQQER